MDVLNYMRLFVEVAKRKSFRAAADALDMPNSTLSRNIAELEKSIGLRLLHRSTRRVDLTEAGEVYFQRCQGIVEEALGAHKALQDFSEQAVGTLRVSLTSSFAIGYLTPILGEFTSAYPQIRFDFDISSRPVDLQSEPFDMAIRMGPPPTAPSSLVVRRIALMPRYMYASPQYLRNAPPLEHALDLHNHILCGRPCSSKVPQIWHEMLRGEEVAKVDAGARFGTNSAIFSMTMAANGLCVSALDPHMAEQEVRIGRLVRVLPDWHMAPIQVHVITDTRHLPARSKLFIEFLVRRLGGREYGLAP